MTNSFRQQIFQTQKPGQQDVSAMGRPSGESVTQSVGDQTEVAKAKENSGHNVEIKAEPFFANPDKKFESKVAILYVKKYGDQFYLHIHNGEQDPLETTPIKRPKLSLSQLMGEGKQPSEILGFIKMFLNSNPQAHRLQIWLKELQKTLKYKYEQRLSCLIIDDSTDFEIPWEMLDLDDKPIGASVATVHWPKILDLDSCDWNDGEKLLHWSNQVFQCRGSVMAYANTTELHAVNDEVEILSNFNTNCFNNIHDFLNCIEQAQVELSLLFIASHGFFNDDLVEIAFGEQKAVDQRISLIDLYTWKFKAFKIFPSVVFMNACHSGRLCSQDSHDILGPDYREGFPTFFLKQGAKGVVGTLGEVGDRYAAQIAKNFFDNYCHNPDLTVAEILRNLRADIVHKLQAEKSPENWYLFLYTFMYVYYGHPLTVLQLTPAGGQANG